MCLR